MSLLLSHVDRPYGRFPSLYNTGHHDRYAQCLTTEISRLTLFTEKSLTDLDEAIVLGRIALELLPSSPIGPASPSSLFTGEPRSFPRCPFQPAQITGRPR